MKKLLIILCALFMLLSISGCKKSEDNDIDLSETVSQEEMEAILAQSDLAPSTDIGNSPTEDNTDTEQPNMDETDTPNVGDNETQDKTDDSTNEKDDKEIKKKNSSRDGNYDETVEFMSTVLLKADDIRTGAFVSDKKRTPTKEPRPKPETDTDKKQLMNEIASTLQQNITEKHNYFVTSMINENGEDYIEVVVNTTKDYCVYLKYNEDEDKIEAYGSPYVERTSYYEGHDMLEYKEEEKFDSIIRYIKDKVDEYIE